MARFKPAPVGAFQPRVIAGKGLGKEARPLEIMHGNSRRNVLAGESQPRRPVAFAGGAQSDSYLMKPGQLSIIADLGGGDRDTLDFSLLDRESARWGKIRIGNDYILADIIGGTVMVLHDPLGVVDPNNRIESVKAQYRDPLTGVVDPARRQRVDFAFWLENSIDVSSAFGIASDDDLDRYNQVLEGLRILDGQGEGVLQQAIADATGLPFFAPALADLARALPLTGELGLPDAAAVAAAWQTAADNLASLG